MVLRSALMASLVVAALARPSAAQTPAASQATQYPPFLTNSYFGINVGLINYGFSGQELQPGFHAASVDVPHVAARIDLFGHAFSKHLSAQVIYMRPGRFVAYNDINGDQQRRQVSTAFGGVTLSSSMPITARVSLYGEGGWGVTSRAGLEIDGRTVLERAHFGGALLGGGVTYHATPTIDVLMSATYLPGRQSQHEPAMRLFTTGFRYNMRKLPDAEADENRRAGFFFPANIARVGLTSGALGYGANTFFSSTVPIFWGGNVRTAHGVTFDFERNVFHTRKRFAFDLGVSASTWTSRDAQQGFRTLSAYPLFRFMLWRTQPADLYASYSLAGPSYLSRTFIDGRDTGAHFTFQDFMAIGAFLGAARRVDVELGIKHFSNGNIFTPNAAIRVPLTFTVGWMF